MKKPIRYPLRFERRRYGRTTITWVYATINGVEYQLGDPWPHLRPALREMRIALSDVLRKIRRQR